MTISVIAISAEQASSANIAAIIQPPAFLSLFILVAAAACAVVCFQVVQLVRGGHLSKSWQIFLGGFIVLALSQFFTLCNNLELFTTPGWIVPVLLLAMSGLFFYGLFELRRILE